MTDTRRIYLVAVSEPDPLMARRYALDDAREVAARHNERFPQMPANIWRVERDGTVRPL